jgi:ComEC/Rec2-related protein
MNDHEATSNHGMSSRFLLGCQRKPLYFLPFPFYFSIPYLSSSMQRTHITHLPAVSLCAGCGLGVLFVWVVQPSEVLWLLASGVMLVIGIGIVLLKPRFQSQKRAWMRFAAYWSAALLCGGWMGINVTRTTMNVPLIVRYGFVSDVQAVVHGELVQILKRDSASVRCIVAGSIDGKPFTRRENSRIALTIFTLQKADARFRNAMAEDMHIGTRIYAPCKVRPPRIPTLPTDFNEQQYFSSLDVQWLATTSLPRVSVLSQATTLARFMEQATETLHRSIMALFPSKTEGFALALLTGDRSLLPAETQREYALAGTAHILAVSGLHIGLVAVIVLVPLAWLPRRRFFAPMQWLKLFLFSTIIAAFVLLTGASPSAVRSGVMAVLLLLVRVMQREAHPLNIVASTALVTLVVQPSWMLSVSFQLSVLAVTGIAALYPMLQERFGLVLHIHKRAFMRPLAASLALTTASSLIVTPLVAWYFGTVSLIAPLANLVIVPLSSVAMLYTLVAVGMSWLPLLGWPVATVFAATAHILLWAMNVINHYSATLSFSAVQGSHVQMFCVALGGSLALLFVFTADRTRLVMFRAVAVLCIGMACLWLFKPFVELTPTYYIIPRPQMVAAALPCKAHRSLILLQDRRYDAIPRSDVGLERFLGEITTSAASRHDSLLLCVTGPTSMLCASRISSRLQANGMTFRILATSLQYKQPRMFAALDSLEAQGVRVVNAQDLLRRDSIVSLPMLQGRVEWHPWKAALKLSSGEWIHLPTITQVAEDIQKP